MIRNLWSKFVCSNIKLNSKLNVRSFYNTFDFIPKNSMRLAQFLNNKNKTEIKLNSIEVIKNKSELGQFDLCLNDNLSQFIQLCDDKTDLEFIDYSINRIQSSKSKELWAIVVETLLHIGDIELFKVFINFKRETTIEASISVLNQIALHGLIEETLEYLDFLMKSKTIKETKHIESLIEITMEALSNKSDLKSFEKQINLFENNKKLFQDFQNENAFYFHILTALELKKYDYALETIENNCDSIKTEFSQVVSFCRMGIVHKALKCIKNISLNQNESLSLKVVHLINLTKKSF
jgi:hypothetical protein